jgi:cytochrome oxidase Cu insertion factor (SCO1/SenC/PrrC family)
MAVCVFWAFGTGWLFFKVQSKFMKLRPTAEDEMQGLDVPEMGVEAYPDFELTDVNGNPIRLSSYHGQKPVVLAFLRGFM